MSTRSSAWATGPLPCAPPGSWAWSEAGPARSLTSPPTRGLARGVVNRLSVFVVAGPGLAGRVGAGSPVPVVPPESADLYRVSFPGSVRRGPGAGASPGPLRWLDQKHAHRRDHDLGGVAHYTPAS